MTLRLRSLDGDWESCNDDFEGLEVVKTAVPTVPQIQCGADCLLNCITLTAGYNVSSEP